MIDLEDGAHIAWEGSSGWAHKIPGMRVLLFVLVFVLNGFDFQSCFYRLSSLAMWNVLLKDLHARDISPELLLGFEDEKVTVDKEEVVKFVAVASHYRRESAFPRKQEAPRTSYAIRQGKHHSIGELG